MEFFRIRKDSPFMKYALIFNVISILTFVLAVFFLVTRGLHLSVEFTGGTVMEVSYTQAADLPKVRDTVGSLGYRDVVVQNFGTARDVMITCRCKKGSPPPSKASKSSPHCAPRMPGWSCAAPNSSAPRWARSS